MLENVTALPVWNRKSSAADRFEELAVMARKNPEKFERVMVIWNHVMEKAGEPGVQLSVTDYALVGELDTMGLYGLLKLAELEVLAVTRGRGS